MHVSPRRGLNARANTHANYCKQPCERQHTTGFKRDRANFETLLYPVGRIAGDQTTAVTILGSSFSVGTGARIAQYPENLSQGSMSYYR